MDYKLQGNINRVVCTNDGSKTLFSELYNQHYHNINEGAISETLIKHILPAINYHREKEELNILDICFGLGYNTFTLIYFIKKESLHKKVNIFSPELDSNLIKSLQSFDFPKEFEFIKNIINQLSINSFYEDEDIKIEIFIGNAREYIKSLPKDFFNIIFQDAFSSDVNFELWTKEYFDDLFNIANKDCILTTYSIASKVRLSMNEAGFFNYEYILPNKRKSTLAFKQKQEKVGKYIDMQLKKMRNKELQALYDKDLLR